MEKRGISHVEVIMSFVIFLGFVIFLLAIFNPLKNSGYSDVSLNIAERGIRSYSGIVVDLLTLRLNKSVEECFYFVYNSSLKNIIVKNADYESVDAYSEDISAERKDDKKEKKRTEKRLYISREENFYYIYSSDDFEERNFDSRNCVNLKEKDYAFGLFNSFDMLSYERLENFTDEYINDYENLKKKTGLPSGKDFSFNLKDSLGNSILNATRKIPKVKVFAKSEYVQLAYNDGTIKYVILDIQTW